MMSLSAISATEFPSVVDFDREHCDDLGFSESREWLVTNGIGGYGFGTVAGHQTRSNNRVEIMRRLVRTYFDGGTGTAAPAAGLHLPFSFTNRRRKVTSRTTASFPVSSRNQ
jgi:hypothetical protein